MTHRRWSEITRGKDAPRTRKELQEFGKLQARTRAVLQPLAPSIGAAAKAYPTAVRVISRAPKAGRRRLERMPLVVVAAMARPNPSARTVGVSRARRKVVRSHARSPGRSSDDEPHELPAALAALIDAHGPRSACWLATEVRRRKSVVLETLRSGPFVCFGRGRAAKWDNAPVAPIAVRDAVWQARRSGELTAEEALEVLVASSPALLAMFVEAVA